MKKIKLNNGLKLNKEAITKLQESQLSSFRGGKGEQVEGSCLFFSCNGKHTPKEVR